MNTSRTIIVEQARGKARSQYAAGALLAARREGATLREAAEAAGVHVATVCRWQNRDPSLREALEQALNESLSESEDPQPLSARPPKLLEGMWRPSAAESGANDWG